MKLTRLYTKYMMPTLTGNPNNQMLYSGNAMPNFLIYIQQRICRFSPTSFLHGGKNAKKWYEKHCPPPECLRISHKRWERTFRRKIDKGKWMEKERRIKTNIWFC